MTAAHERRLVAEAEELDRVHLLHESRLAAETTAREIAEACLAEKDDELERAQERLIEAAVDDFRLAAETAALEAAESCLVDQGAQLQHMRRQFTARRAASARASSPRHAIANQSPRYRQPGEYSITSARASSPRHGRYSSSIGLTERGRHAACQTAPIIRRHRTRVQARPTITRRKTVARFAELPERWVEAPNDLQMQIESVATQTDGGVTPSRSGSAGTSMEVTAAASRESTPGWETMSTPREWDEFTEDFSDVSRLTAEIDARRQVEGQLAEVTAGAREFSRLAHAQLEQQTADRQAAESRVAELNAFIAQAWIDKGVPQRCPEADDATSKEDIKELMNLVLETRKQLGQSKEQLAEERSRGEIMERKMEQMETMGRKMQQYSDAYFEEMVSSKIEEDRLKKEQKLREEEERRRQEDEERREREKAAERRRQKLLRQQDIERLWWPVRDP